MNNEHESIHLARDARDDQPRNRATARVATTSSSTSHSGLSAIDGVTPVSGDIIFDWNNSTASLRGLWIARSGSWIRAKVKLFSGMQITVRSGTLRGNTLWQLVTADPIVRGTTSLSFSQLSQSVAFVTARVKSPSSVTHSGTATIDGVAVVAGDRVFDAPNVYTVASGSWSTYATSPDAVGVTEGDDNGPMIWIKDGAGTHVPVAGAYA